MELGLHITHDDATSKLDPQVISISEVITPNDSKEFGRVWDLFQAKDTRFETDEFEVLKREYTVPEVSLTASGSSADWDTTSDTTALPVSSSYIDRITVGDMLLVENEIVVVKSVNRSANTIDVYERGAGETDAAAHGTSAVTAKVIGNAHVEGKADAEAMAEGTKKYTNYCQLLEEEVDLSHADTEQARKVGRTAPILRREAMERVRRDMARTAVYGTAAAPSGSTPGLTRGFLQWLGLSDGIQTNVGGAFTETTLQNGFDDIRKQGGSPNAIVMSVSKKRTFNDFTGVDSVETVRRDTQGGHLLQSYLADGFGDVPVIVDIDMPDDQVAIVDSRRMQKGWKKGDLLRYEARTDVNPRENKELLHGKFGLAMENIGESHGLLTNLT